MIAAQSCENACTRALKYTRVVDSKRIRHITGASGEKIGYMLTKVAHFTLEVASTKLAGLRGL